MKSPDWPIRGPSQVFVHVYVEPLLGVGKMKFPRERLLGAKCPEVFMSEVLTGCGAGFLEMVASCQALLTVLPLS